MKVPLIRFLCLLCLNVLPAAAFAQTCTFGATNLTFSGSPISGAAINGMSTITANCSGLLGLGRKVLVCPNLNEGSGGATAAARRMLSGANILNYQLYQDSARQIVWGSPTWPYPARAPGFLVEFTTILSPLLGSGTNSVTLYGRVLANQTTAPVGTYLSTFSGAQAPFRYRYDDGLGCNAASGTSGSPPAFNVSLMTVKDCLVSAQNINFGSHGVLGANLDQTGQVTVTCSPTTPYA
ncbi:MAG: Csu type fimbrial protein, partial [Phyllobacterium sp.]